jgi:hypothetical protein
MKTEVFGKYAAVSVVGRLILDVKNDRRDAFETSDITLPTTQRYIQEAPSRHY